MQIGDAISAWKKGALTVALICMFGIGAPIVVLVFLSVAIILPMSILGFSLEFLDEGFELILVVIGIFGPYFIGNAWEHIGHIVSPPKTDDLT